MTNTSSTLWIDSDRRRYFFIPDDHTFAPGEAEIWNPLSDGKKKVDLTTLSDFEIPPDVAQEHLGTDFGEAVQQIKGLFSGFIELAKQLSAPSPAGATAKNAEADTSLDSLAKALGLHADQFKDDPAGFQKALQELVVEAQTILKSALTDDPVQLQTAEQQARALRQKLRSQGIHISKKLENLPRQLHRLYQSTPDSQAQLTNGIDQLQQLTNLLNQSTATGQSLDELNQTLTETFKDILTKEAELRRQQEREKYRQSAEQAIDDSVKIKPIDFQGLIAEVKQSQQEKQDNRQKDGQASAYQRFNAAQAFNTLGEFLKAKKWYPQQLEGEFAYQAKYYGRQGPYICYAQIRADLEQFVFYVMAPFKVPAETRTIMAEFIIRINYNLRIGDFQLDFDDGAVRYKSSLDFEGETLTSGLIKNTITPAVTTLEKYLPSLMSVAQGDKSIEEAMAENLGI